MAKHPLQSLLDILEEEISIMEPEDPEEETILKDMESAMAKIRDANTPFIDLTPGERAAIKYALEDVGELYLFTGTSAGFDLSGLTEADRIEHVHRGEQSRVEAATLGIYPGGN